MPLGLYPFHPHHAYGISICSPRPPARSIPGLAWSHTWRAKTDGWTQGWGWSVQPCLHAGWPLVCKSSLNCKSPLRAGKTVTATWTSCICCTVSSAPFSRSFCNIGGCCRPMPCLWGSFCAGRWEQGWDQDPGTAATRPCWPQRHGWALQRGCPGLLAELLMLWGTPRGSNSAPATLVTASWPQKGWKI